MNMYLRSVPKRPFRENYRHSRNAERMTAKVAAVLGLSEATGTDGAFSDAGDGTGSQSGAGFGNKQNDVHGGGAGAAALAGGQKKGSGKPGGAEKAGYC